MTTPDALLEIAKSINHLSDVVAASMGGLTFLGWMFFIFKSMGAGSGLSNVAKSIDSFKYMLSNRSFHTSTSGLEQEIERIYKALQQRK